MNNLSIVILNWNGKQFLEDFLPSVIKYSTGAEIVVADNASTDSSISFLKTHYPEIRIIENSSNGGFAKGYNDALKQVETDLYLLLNSDIEVTENWLVPLLKKMENPLVAGCQPKVLSYQHKHQFEHAGACGGYLDRNYFPFCRGRIFDKFEEDHAQYDSETEIFWATGAALLIRSKVFHLVNGFDETFFAHMEEIDMCWRAKKIGYQFWVVPSSVVYHVGGGTLPYTSPRKTYLNFRNSLFMIVKNHPGLLFPKLFYRLSLDGIAGWRFLLKGEFKQLMAVLNAHVAMYAQLSSLLKKRKAIKQTRTNPNSAGLYGGSILWARYFKGVTHFSNLNQRLFRK